MFLTIDLLQDTKEQILKHKNNKKKKGPKVSWI